MYGQNDADSLKFAWHSVFTQYRSAGEKRFRDWAHGESRKIHREGAFGPLGPDWWSRSRRDFAFSW